MSAEADDAFADFVAGRSLHLLKLARLLTGQNRADAEDLLQLALERAYRRKAWLFRGGSPEPYVRRVLVNASIDRWRRLRRHREASLDGLDNDLAGPDQTGDVPCSGVTSGLVPDL